jgi:AcrR family transcriptional regulator
VTADARLRLLQAGLALAPHVGLRGLTVRGVAQRAQVNLGSFVYHFGSREAFVAELIEHWYAPFYERLRATGHTPAPVIERLRALLAELAAFVIQNRAFIAHVLMDAAAGESGARRFVQSLAQRHPALLLAALAEAQRTGAVRKEPAVHQMMFLFGAVGLPIVFIGALAARRILPREMAMALRGYALDLAAARVRIDWALRGIAV